jgi:antitoxin ParD1/3/4
LSGELALRDSDMGLNVSIADDLTRFIEAKVQSGEYPSADAVIEHALQLLEESQKTDKEKLAWLRAAVEEGEASGDAGPLDIEALKDEARRLSAANRDLMQVRFSDRARADLLSCGGTSPSKA